MSANFMANYESTYLSSDGTSKIAYYVWLPEDTTAARGIVQIIHGMCEHSGRYGNFASFLTQNGYIVCQNENLGHGKTGKAALGYMGEKDGDIHLVRDAYKLTEIIKEKYQSQSQSFQKPFYLLGHSMGSFIARQYCAEYADASTSPDAAIFSGTSGGGLIFAPLRALIKLQIKIKGAKASGEWINKLNGKMYNKKFLPAKTGYEWLSRDESVWTAFANDEMCNFSFTLGGYRDLMTLIIKISRKGWAERTNKEMPVFLLSGLDDPVGDYGRGVIKVYKNLVEAAHKHVYIKLYENGRHEMLNETNKEEVYGDILYFLDHGGKIGSIDE